MKNVDIIVPVYNEESVIDAFYSELTKVRKSLADSYRINVIFVVDKCRDRSLELLGEIAAKDQSVRVIGLSKRWGHQMSLVAGMDHCSGDAVIMMDGDLQHPPEVIPELLKKFEEGNDIVYTTRVDAPEIGFFKRITSKMFYFMINMISPVKMNTSAADFRLISNKVLKTFQTSIRERNQFLRGLFSWVGFKNIGVKFKSRKRQAGKSKYSLRRMISFAFTGVVSFSKLPLKISIFLGFIFAILSFSYGLYAFIYYIATDKQLIEGWASTFLLIALLGGIQLICIGVIGEYIGWIFDEVKGRPLYIIDTKFGFKE